MANDNLYLALTSGFADLQSHIAIQTLGPTAMSYRYADLLGRCAQIANLLSSLNLPAGSRVVLQTEKSVEALITYLAVLRQGHVFVPLNPAYQAAEMAYFLADAEPAVVICKSAQQAAIQQCLSARTDVHLFTLDDNRTGTLLEAADRQSQDHAVVTRASHDLAAILYTSGTTGRSKGAMLSHGNLLSNAKTLVDYWQFTSKDVLLHALPIFHIHGLFVACHCALLSKAKMLWFASFQPASVVQALPEVTVFMGVPTLYVRLLNEPALSTDTANGVRVFISGSAPLLPETFSQWESRTGQRILERYGMSETAMLTSNPYSPTAGKRRAGTVGKPLPGVSVRIRDANGEIAGAGVIGAVEVTGPGVFAGYWRKPEITQREFTEDGWFKTGDVGQFDEEGYLKLVGRAKDLIITGGLNVYPAEVEDYLNALPGVVESAVIGVPHADFGEGVVAVVVKSPEASVNPEAIIQTMKATVANFKVPKAVFVVSDLPRNAMGKVQKNLLRERYQKALTP